MYHVALYPGPGYEARYHVTYSCLSVDVFVTRWKEQSHSAQQIPSPDKRTPTTKCAKLIEEI